MKYGNKAFANLFLLIAFFLFIGTFLINISSIWIYILQRASEAALIGGIADWFAVTALFKHPFNLRIPHTNIIENNKERLINTVSNMVNDTWLGKNFLGAEINKIDFYGIIIKIIEKDKYNKKIRFYSRKYLIKFLKYVKTDKFNKFVNGKISEALDENLSEKIVKGITLFVKGGDFDKTYGILAGYIKNYAAKYETKDITKKIIELSSMEIMNSIKISGKRLINDNFDNAIINLCDFANITIDKNESSLKKQIREVIEKYKDDSVIKKIFIFIARETNVLDVELLSNEIIAKIKNFINEIRNDPLNDIRLNIKDYTLSILDNLDEGVKHQVLNNIETIIHKNSDKLKDYLLSYLDKASGKRFIKSRLLSFIKSDGNNIISQFNKPIKNGLMTAGLNTVKAIIENNKSYILNKNLFKEKFDYGINLIQDEISKKSGEINSFFRRNTVYAMKLNHSIIGKLVKRYLESLDHKKLVGQIESKIGNDLQYIRINGALVGSIVGILIALIGLFLKSVR